MVDNDHSLTVEAASMFSHALSTHNVDNEIDFFSAVDDLQPKEEFGAGMTSTLEFNSATYYRFVALNLNMLADADHLGSLSNEERQSVVRAFVEATIKAIPSARKNTMNANTLPVYVLGVVREKGHPIQLVNAFENPVRQSQGYAEKSVEQMTLEYAKLKETWGIEATFDKAIPDVGLKPFIEGMVSHVI
jgi:CRISPR system Cascade subunit CasC